MIYWGIVCALGGGLAALLASRNPRIRGYRRNTFGRMSSRSAILIAKFLFLMAAVVLGLSFLRLLAQI
jgi:cytochrome c biogenesis factor